ncbi:MAG: hypothetical protein AA908_10180 [Chlorobi bacterium NICIL-2]|nr:MAG: hypothetical protein AA908_10180 [Chlorobi bacterium NICIL-2]
MLGKLFRRLMISCDRATFLIEKQSTDSLSWIEWMQLKLHVSMCAACRAYGKQSRMIDRLLKKYFHPTQSSAPTQEEITFLQERMLPDIDASDEQ